MKVGAFLFGAVVGGLVVAVALIDNKEEKVILVKENGVKLYKSAKEELEKLKEKCECFCEEFCEEYCEECSDECCIDHSDKEDKLPPNLDYL